MVGLIELVLSLIAGLIAIVVHEFPKAILAVSLGDDTPKYNGKFTLNPFKHMDPIGFILLLSTQVGWSYPVEFNPNNFKNKRIGTIIVSSMGIISSLIFVTILIVLNKSFPLTISEEGLYIRFFIEHLVYYSISLAVLNILPITPLSITKIISIYWPRNYFKLLQYEKILHVIFLLLFFLNIIPLIVINISNYTLQFIQLIIY